jgi:hypothetical protein
MVTFMLLFGFFFFIEYCYDYARKVKLCDNLVMFMFIMLLFLLWSWPFVKFVFNSIQELFVFVFFRASHLWFKLDAWGGRFQKSVGRNNLCCARVVIIIMNQKFGGGRQPTGTPSLARSCVVVVVSLLAGASVVHNTYNPEIVTLSLSLSLSLSWR